MRNRSMFVGLDVHKETIDVSIAGGARQGEVRHYGVAERVQPQFRPCAFPAYWLGSPRRLPLPQFQ